MSRRKSEVIYEGEPALEYVEVQKIKDRKRHIKVEILTIKNELSTYRARITKTIATLEQEHSFLTDKQKILQGMLEEKIRESNNSRIDNKDY